VAAPLKLDKRVPKVTLAGIQEREVLEDQICLPLGCATWIASRGSTAKTVSSIASVGVAVRHSHAATRRHH
jgi:hypothetical protein